jgi:hypothetical protein
VLVVSRMKDGIDRPLAVYAGLIDKTSYDAAGRSLTVTHKELRSIAADRFGSMVPSYAPGGSFSVSGKSLRGIARAVIAKGFLSAPGDNWHFPVVLPADESGSQERIWHNYNLNSIEDMLSEVQDADGGPDIAFDPIWTAGMRLEWWARIGTPRIANNWFEWSLSAPDTPVLSFVEDVDSSKQRSGMFVPGEGSEEKMLVGRSPAGGIAGSGMPDRDGLISMKSVDSQSELNSLALSALKTHREPARTTSFSLDGPGTDIGDTFRLGARTRIWVQDDPFLTDGWRDGYVVGLSGGMSTEVSVEVQPV